MCSSAVVWVSERSTTPLCGEISQRETDVQEGDWSLGDSTRTIGG